MSLKSLVIRYNNKACCETLCPGVTGKKSLIFISNESAYQNGTHRHLHVPNKMSRQILKAEASIINVRSNCKIEVADTEQSKSNMLYSCVHSLLTYINKAPKRETTLTALPFKAKEWIINKPSM